MARRNLGYGSSVEWLRGPGPMSWRRTYPGRADQVVVARKFAVSLLAGSGREGEVEFIVAEFVSNALLYTRSGHVGGWFGLEIAITELAYIAVTDLGGGRTVPTVRPEQVGGELHEGGRGLLGVSKLAVAIGIHGSLDGGHTVWADLDLSADGGVRPDLTTRVAM
ncbi:MAG: putative anti-sigma regulatory factor, serine/threonine protein kinase [Streptosporangiaceae bacterium]|nr:putative anti-sigma regulatory factor, serine/threonine protein kinase [Streptosporangiaceae bacterium]